MTIGDAVSGTGRYDTRRPSVTPCPATGDTARDDHLVPEICPEYVRNMPGICLMMPDDVSLLGLSGDRVTDGVSG